MTARDADVAETANELRLAVGLLVRRVRAESPFPVGQLAVLGVLDREGPQTTTQLAAAQLVRHQSMARTVAQLVELGWVQAGPHPSDGRKTQLSLTDAGREHLRFVRGRREDWLAGRIVAELTPAERRTLADSASLIARLAGP